MSALVATGLLLSACEQAEDPAAAGNPAGRSGDGGTVSIAVGFPPDAGYAIDTDDAFFLSRVGVIEPLVEAGVDGVAEPGLALDWTQTDPRTWEFELRPDVTFQDGEAFDADAVVTAIDYVTGVDSPPRSVDGVGLAAEAVDELTVAISTDEPDPVLPLRMSSPNLGILSPAAYESSPPSAQGTATGPFTLTDAAATGATLARNDGYWGSAATLSGAQISFVPDAAARVAALRAGDVDIAQNLPPTSVATLSEAEEITVEQYVAPRVTSLYTSLAEGPLADERVREALELAIDRPLLVDTVLEGTGQPAREVFGAAVSWGETEDPPGADPEAARELLAEAGYGPDDPLSLDLWTYPSRPELPDLATAIAPMLEEVGIRTSIRIAEYATLEPEVLAGDYDLFILSRSYLTDFPDPSGYLSSDFTCEGSYNLNGYCSEDFDDLVAELDETTDEDERVELFQQAADRLADDHVGVPLLHTGAITGLRETVTGYVADPLDRLLLTTELGLTS